MPKKRESNSILQKSIQGENGMGFGGFEMEEIEPVVRAFAEIIFSRSHSPEWECIHVLN
jgi:hypothetical protein